jgi:hypothetical protein
MTARTVSIVVEWSNAHRAEMARAERLLEALDCQIRALDRAVEVLVCVDDTVVDVQAVQSLLARHLGASWRILLLPGHEYYRLKNAGAAASTGEIVVFVDSDVIPADRWLAELLRGLDDETVSAVCGATYIGPASLYAKAFSLFWFFPAAPAAHAIAPAATFFANNVAFRRDVFLRHLFPIDETSRGACLDVAASLAAAGQRLVSNTAAQATHPPPNGGRHFVIRALVQGRDRLLRERRIAGGWRGSVLGSGLRFGGNLRASAARIARERRRANVALWQVPAVAAIAGTYYSLYFCGEVATGLFPARMIKSLRI